MRYLVSADFAAPRAETTTGGFLSPNRNVDAPTYPRPLDQRFARRLHEVEPVRFDASDLMPGAVGSGSFWRSAVKISTGELTVAEAFAAIERDWPPP
jgi:alpha-glucoside transport system substrate-binding protein